ncbi:MAG: succinate dehydrogenase/fumarate reductase flavoprotein subunit, partial [Burkholderiaceae bacterium]
EEIREALLECMWQDVGIVRDGAGLARADLHLAQLEDALNATGMATDERAFNLTWHDWLNLSNLILVSRSIRTAAEHRKESRGAHFRSDYPQRGALDDSTYVTVRFDGQFVLDECPVQFQRVRPGESLLR